jgi:hypothetical protein
MICNRIIHRSEAKKSQIRSEMADSDVVNIEGWLEVLAMVEQLWEEERLVAKGVKQSVLNGVDF